MRVRALNEAEIRLPGEIEEIELVVPGSDLVWAAALGASRTAESTLRRPASTSVNTSMRCRSFKLIATKLILVGHFNLAERSHFYGSSVHLVILSSGSLRA